MAICSVRALTRLLRLGLLGCLFLLAGCQEPLYQAMPEQEINEMLAVLSNNGVTGKKVSAGKGLWNITVDAKELARSVEILSVNGLPRASFQSMGDVFKKDSMVSTPTEEQARLVYAIAQELSGTIALIDGVVNARVHLVLPETDNFGNKISPSKASVFIRHRADADINPQVAQIKRLVQNAVRDLDYDAISVFPFASAMQTPPPLPEETTVLGVTVPQEWLLQARLGAGALALLLLTGAILGARRIMRRGKVQTASEEQ